MASISQNMPVHILGALLKSIAAIRRAYLWKTLFYASLINLALFGGMFYYIYDYISTQGAGIWGMQNLIDWLGPWVAGFITLLALPFTFPLVSLLFLDSTISAVEKRDYPENISEPMPMAKSVESATLLMIVTLVINGLMLPLYFIPGINLLVYFTLNGYLLGREYYEMVALRHMDGKAAKANRKQSRFTFWVAGAMITFSFMLPFLNLLAPIIATIFMVHLFHGTSRPAAAAKN